MSFIRWGLLNSSPKKVMVTVGLVDVLGNPVSCPTGGGQVAESLTVGPGAYAETVAPACTWEGNRVLVSIQDLSTAGTTVKPVLPLALPLGSVDPDNVYEVRVYVERKSTTEVVASVWELDGLGGWWLLLDRATIAVQPPPP